MFISHSERNMLEMLYKIKLKLIYNIYVNIIIDLFERFTKEIT